MADHPFLSLREADRARQTRIGERSFLNANPRAAFSSALSGLDSPQSRFFANRFNPIFDQFQAQLPRNPTRGFSDFLGDFPFLREFQSFSPSQRGSFQSRLRPPTRTLRF